MTLGRRREHDGSILLGTAHSFYRVVQYMVQIRTVIERIDEHNSKIALFKEK
jgi:hypothetical protein